MSELTNTELAAEYTRQHVRIFGKHPVDVDIVNRDATILSVIDLITLSEYKNDRNQNTKPEDCW
jgi:hypothetical protein